MRQTVADIFLDRHLRKKRIRLKDDADAAFARRKLSHVFVVKNDFSGVGLFQTGDDAKDGRLAASGRAEQHKCFTFSHMKRDVLQHARLAEKFTDADNTGGVHGCWLLETCCLRFP